MSWRDQPPEQQTPDWIKAWAVARFKHGDMRLFPEQEPGYRDLHRQWQEDHHEGASGYDWTNELEQHGLMPPKDRARYVEEAAELPDVDIAALMTGTAKVAETPAQDPDGWEQEPAQPVAGRA